MQRIVESTRQREAAATAAAAPEQPPSAVAVYDEMLQDCRKKAGEATLDRLRKLCQKLSRPNADENGGGGAGEGRGGGGEAEGMMVMGEEETVVVSYHAALLGKAEGAANIYGG